MQWLEKESSNLGRLAELTMKDRIMTGIWKCMYRASTRLDINLLRRNSSQISKQKKIDTNACSPWKIIPLQCTHERELKNVSEMRTEPETYGLTMECFPFTQFFPKYIAVDVSPREAYCLPNEWYKNWIDRIILWTFCRGMWTVRGPAVPLILRSFL